MEEKDPIINCHVHIFNGYHVPPFLAKGYVPAPLHKALRLDSFLKYYARFKRRSAEELYEPIHKTERIQRVKRDNRIKRNTVLNFARKVVYGALALHVFLYLFEVLNYLGITSDEGWTTDLRNWLTTHKLYYAALPTWIKAIIAIGLITLIPAIRKQVWYLLKKSIAFLRKIPAEKYKELWNRYKLIAIYASYSYETGSKEERSDRGERSDEGDEKKNKKRTFSMSGQRFIFQKLKAQYPKGSKFVVLPMDMAYMEAGDIHQLGEFHLQMEQLIKLKASETHGEHIKPFIFIDPRRVADEGDSFFSWELDEGKIVLKDCKVKTYLDGGCCGFKIYPALGYFPFDPILLPLWAFAEQEGIPIMSHCVIGTIFYRGKISKDMSTHPVFKRVTGIKPRSPETDIAQLDLLETNGLEYQRNFTHPMNYLCLLDDHLLREVLKACPTRTQELFAQGPDGKFRSLNKLKICLAHFGGVEEWKRHMETDNSVYNQQLTLHPEKGLYHQTYWNTKKKRIQWGLVEAHWEHADWYTIICSMMLAYDNVYADISYILHDEWIKPLLSKTIAHPNKKLGERVLFGTDFYVVRNHKSDKELVSDLSSGLREAQFDLIARANPQNYLASTYY